MLGTGLDIPGVDFGGRELELGKLGVIFEREGAGLAGGGSLGGAGESFMT
jgi:hypothetical protein